MTLVPWLDAAYAPTLAQAQQAHAQGFRAVAFYLPREPGEDPYNTWTPAQVTVLRSAGLVPVPIIVPAPGLTEDPTEAAATAKARCPAYGITPTVSVLYSGNHLETTGQITGPVWLPIVGPAPATVGPGSAVQYGQTVIAGWSVDLNVAAPDFPFGTCVVVDFEHAIGVPPTGLAWYQTFQTHFAAPPPPAPPVPAPPIVLTPNTHPVITEGASMASVIVRLPIGANGEGWGVLDGGTHTDPGSASLTPAVPWAKFVAATPYSDDPARDKPDIPTPLIGVQDRGNYVFIKASGAQPGPSTAVAQLVYTD